VDLDKYNPIESPGFDQPGRRVVATLRWVTGFRQAQPTSGRDPALVELVDASMGNVKLIVLFDGRIGLW
jgi:hypothetical protein